MKTFTASIQITGFVTVKGEAETAEAFAEMLEQRPHSAEDLMEWNSLNAVMFQGFETAPEETE